MSSENKDEIVIHINQQENINTECCNYIIKSSISKEMKKKLMKYEKFKNGKFKKGSGIGLCIVSMILNVMKSNLNIDSPFNNEQGTNFNFIINVKKNNNIINNSIINTDIIKINNIKIVIVDDSNFILKQMSKFLKKKLTEDYFNNCEIITLNSGEKCLEYFNKNKDIHLIVMDENMEEDELTGTETNKLLREKGYNGIIIQSSGNCTEKDNKLYYESGVDHVWGKPIPYNTADEEIKNLLNDKNYYK